MLKLNDYSKAHISSRQLMPVKNGRNGRAHKYIQAIADGIERPLLNSFQRIRSIQPAQPRGFNGPPTLS
jgi:hypothetical protein